MLEIIKKFSIPFFVFITGACVLIIEIAAIKILSPYFGNTIYTVSSVLTVVLAALSIGYYTGGKLADKYTDLKLFFGIIGLAGISVIILHWFGAVFLSKFGYNFNLVEGPIISSFLLFFTQSFLLGTLSPFAVVLYQKLGQIGVGNAAGQIFFWSTLGSIAGSIFAGFYLIPHFGTNAIMLAVGLVLLSLGILGYLKIHLASKAIFIILLFILLPFFIPKYSLGFGNILLEKDSMYQKIIIYDSIYEGRPIRFLMQDKNFSAAMFLNSNELVYEYTKYYILHEIFSSNIKESLMIGGGAWSVPKAILADLPKVSVDVVEIDPLLINLAKQYFNVPDDSRLRNFAQDGRKFLFNSQKQYDFIFSDAYSSFFSTPEHLTTKEFFQLAKDKMNNNGIFIANVIGSLQFKPQSFLFSEMKTFKNVFENSYFFAVNSPDYKGIQNIIFVGFKNNNKIIDFNSPEILNNSNPIISNLSKKLIYDNKIDFSFFPILTDDYAPVDYLISKEFTNLR